jgi:hypothetical protein
MANSSGDSINKNAILLRFESTISNDNGTINSTQSQISHHNNIIFNKLQKNIKIQVGY